MYFFIYRDAAREIRWTLYAANNRKLANSGEGYRNKQDCVDAINLFARDGIRISVQQGL